MYEKGGHSVYDVRTTLTQRALAQVAFTANMLMTGSEETQRGDTWTHRNNRNYRVLASTRQVTRLYKGYV